MAQRNSQSRPSGVLNPNDNHLVFSLLGPRVQSLSTAVVQLFTSSHGQPWHLEVTGVACVVKDSNRRSYYIQVFHMDRRFKVFEQEIYTEFRFKGTKPDVYVFEADQQVAALYFANVKEADDFNVEVEKRLAKLKYSVPLQRQRGGGPNIAMEEGPGVRPGVVHKVDLERPTEKKTKKQKDHDHLNFFGTWSRRKGPKITKTEIGAPTNFIHLKGVQPSRGGFEMVDNTNELEPGLRALFQMSGVDVSLLSDPTKKSEIEKFKKENEAAIRVIGKRETRRIKANQRAPMEGPPPPPPPKKAVKPPRAPKQLPLEPDIQQKQVHKAEVTPPLSSAGGAPTPPPPPPPPPPPIPLGPIGITPQLPPVNPPSAKPIRKETPQPDSRADMLSAIRQFGQGNAGLRHVTNTEQEKLAPVNDGSIIGILQAKLNELAPHLNHSSSEDEEEDEEEEWE